MFQQLYTSCHHCCASAVEDHENLSIFSKKVDGNYVKARYEMHASNRERKYQPLKEAKSDPQPVKRMNSPENHTYGAHTRIPW